MVGEIADDKAGVPIVILVHGTWARRANWTKPTSGIVMGLRGLGADVVIFSWSGRNRHASRMSAGSILHEELLTLRDRFPDRPIHLVGHSHGGNVALYALSEPNPQLDEIAVTTLATPFIAVEEFEWPRPIWFALALMAVLSLFVWMPIVAAGLDGSEIGPALIPFVPMVIAVGLFLADVLGHLALRKRRPAARELVTHSPGPRRLLTIGGLGDEAASVLLFSSFAGRMTRRVSELTRFMPMLGLGTLIMFILVLLTPADQLSLEETWQTLQGLVWLVPLVAASVVLLLFYAAQLVVGLDGIGYGMSYLFTVDSSPVGLSVAARVETPPGSESVHAVYEWAETTQWILWHVERAHNLVDLREAGAVQPRAETHTEDALVKRLRSLR